MAYESPSACYNCGKPLNFFTRHTLEDHTLEDCIQELKSLIDKLTNQVAGLHQHAGLGYKDK